MTYLNASLGTFLKWSGWGFLGVHQLQLVQTLETEKGARTLGLDFRTHKIYLPIAQFQTATSSAVGMHHPEIVPGTLKLLVYGLADQNGSAPIQKESP